MKNRTSSRPSNEEQPPKAVFCLIFLAAWRVWNTRVSASPSSNADHERPAAPDARTFVLTFVFPMCCHEFPGKLAGAVPGGVFQVKNECLRAERVGGPGEQRERRQQWL